MGDPTWVANIILGGWLSYHIKTKLGPNSIPKSYLKRRKTAQAHKEFVCSLMWFSTHPLTPRAGHLERKFAGVDIYEWPNIGLGGYDTMLKNGLGLNSTHKR